MSAEARGTIRRVASKDGTKIAFDRQGHGPAVILVAGAFTTRLGWTGTGLSKLLAPRFTVISYDRRGRGESGNTLPYGMEREIEDIEALIGEAGGKAVLYGHSSGAALALEAALRLGDRISKLALYEAPYNDDPSAVSAWKEYIKELTRLLAQDRRGDAAALFMKYVGTPAAQIEGMRHAPMWPGLEGMAHTLAYDHTAIMGDNASVPVARVARIKAGTLVMAGSASPPFMRETARTLGAAIPGAQVRILEGQTHDVNAEVQAPILAEFFRK